MNHSFALKTGAVCFGATLFATVYWHPGAPRVEAAPQVEDPKFRYVGADTCKSCHEKPQEQYKDSFDFVRLDEYETWKNQDKHSRAFEVLQGERAQSIGKSLGIVVTEDARCLNCHAMNFQPARRGRLFKLQDGVTCDGCHGPASGWLSDHIELDWRTQPPAAKSALGMRDIRDPVKKAEMCLSCHVGNAADNKVLTHAMYAAGHPPLPAFELETFCEKLPRHWRTMKEKPLAIQQQFNFDPAASERAKGVLIGGVVALRESMRLLAEQTGQGRLDFAQYDCYACHHELQAKSWRQERGYAGMPGRPSMPEWPSALVELAVHAAAPKDAQPLLEELRTQLGKLRAAYDARPFGDPVQMAKAAKEVADWTDQLLARLKPLKITETEARRLLLQLTAITERRTPDYDSAWQLAWALDAMLRELEPKPTGEVQAAWKRLEAGLDLKLPSGKGQEIMTHLPRRFKAMDNYDPGQLKKHFAELGRLLTPR